jgi:hypothetical protein
VSNPFSYFYSSTSTNSSTTTIASVDTSSSSSSSSSSLPTSAAATSAFAAEAAQDDSTFDPSLHVFGPAQLLILPTASALSTSSSLASPTSAAAMAAKYSEIEKRRQTLSRKHVLRFLSDFSELLVRKMDGVQTKIGNIFTISSLFYCAIPHFPRLFQSAFSSQNFLSFFIPIEPLFGFGCYQCPYITSRVCGSTWNAHSILVSSEWAFCDCTPCLMK